VDQGVRANGADIPVRADGTVQPGAGGLSVVPNWRSLPPFLVPHRLLDKYPRARGNAKLACFRLSNVMFVDDAIGDALQLRIDSPDHGTIQPRQVMPVNVYQAELAATRNTWMIDED
jgi:hypothetical protein